MSGNYCKELKNILSDKTSGSSGIVLKLNKYIASVAGSPERISEAISAAGKNLSHFSAVNNYIAGLKKVLQSYSAKKILEFTGSVASGIEDRNAAIFTNALKYIKGMNTFLTLSNSNILLDFFTRLGKGSGRLKIIVAESRPRLEGRIFARRLLKCGIKAELITDSMISLFIPKSSAVILGADMILKDGSVVNKTGSRAAAMLAKRLGKPVFVIASKNKSTKKRSYKPSKENPSEVWMYKHKNLTVSNLYFEVIEKELITKIITD